MTDQQTSRTNITEALAVAMRQRFRRHGVPLDSWTDEMYRFEAMEIVADMRLAAEPRSDAVTAPDEPSTACTAANPHGECRFGNGPAKGKYTGWRCYREARAASASVPPLDAATEGDIRYLLWVLHGHEGRYGDDGEMQCGWCHLDYRRDPLSKITAHLTSLSSSLDRYAAETPEQGRGDESR